MIQEALDRLMQGRTTLIFAHRLSSVIGADRILALDDGRVAETGTHAELMARRGAYHRLMAAQAQDGARRRGRASGWPSGSTSSRRTRPRRSRPDSRRRRGAAAPGTEGVILAQGMGWPRLIRVLLGLVQGYRGQLAATFVLGVARVVALIGVGVLSALVVTRVKMGQPFGALARGARRGGAARGPPALDRIVARPRHGLPAAHRHAPRHVPEARRPGARLSDAPPHGRPRGRRHPRHRADRVLLRPHHHAGLRRRPRPRRRARHALGLRLAARPGAPAVPRSTPRSRPSWRGRAHRSAGLAGARDGGRSECPRRRLGAGARRDRRLPARAGAGRGVRRQGAATTWRCACRSSAT